MKRNNIIWIVLILVISVSGYVLAFIQRRDNIRLERQILKEDVQDIGLIDKELIELREEKSITLEELKESKERLEQLIQAAESKDTTNLSLEEALKIINGL